MIPGWTPPTELKTVTPQAYAALRVLIEAGCAETGFYIDGGLNIMGGYFKRRPDLADSAVMFFQYVPAASVPLAPAQAILEKLRPDVPFKLADEDRPGWPTFVSRTTLIQALDAVTPPEVLAQVGGLARPPDKAGVISGMDTAAVADDDSREAAGLALEWWALALAAGGVLFWLGRTNFAGITIGLLARQLLKLLVVGGAFVLFTEAATKMLEKLGDGAKRATGGLLPLAIGGGAVVLLAAVLLTRTGESPRRKRLTV